jgi:hypothetical protein
MFNKELAREVSSVNGAIIFGQLCSSYESFSSKNMLTRKDGKEYFFLTSEVIEEETTLTYKQQLKAIKELEASGYIETKQMGVPCKKYFHITNKIYNEFVNESKSSSYQREDVNSNENTEDTSRKTCSSYDLKSTLALPNVPSMPLQNGSTIKDKNKKEKDKNNKLTNLVNKELVNNERIIYSLTNEFRNKGLSKEVCMRVLDEVKQKEDEIENFGAYLRICLENTLYRSKVKKGEIDPYKRIEDRLKDTNVPFYNWLEDKSDDLPY